MNCRDDAPYGEVATTGRTRMDFDPLSKWTLDVYRRKCAGLMDVKRFKAMAVDGKNLLMYDRNRFECDTAWSA